MANADLNNSTSKRTVDDVFQILIAREVPPLVAKKQITEALQLGKLRIDFHIAAGARKTRPMRQATPEELKAAAQAGKSLDFLYEAAPEGGITAAVNPQSWDGLFALAIRDDHLIIEPRYALDFPWSAYSFSISNWEVVIEELGRAATAPKPEPMSVSIVGPIEVIERRDNEPAHYRRIRAMADSVFPDGWRHRRQAHVLQGVAKQFKERGEPVPNRDTLRRALGYRE
jgi:hypothetical protein